MKKLVPLAWALGMIVGCAMGPDYHRPDLSLPPEFRGETKAQAQTAAMTFGDLKSFEVFQEQTLQELIRQAVANNYDVRIAAQRVLEVRAGLTIATSELYPELEGAYEYKNRRFSKLGLTPLGPGLDRDRDSNFLTANLSWEVDFWGRIRRAIEAANAEYLASEENRKFVIQTLVAILAQAYFELLELNREIEISRRTLSSREESLRLINSRLEEGVSNKLEWDQAAALVYSAARLIPDLERRIEVKENQINFLLGRDPGPVKPGSPLPEQRLAFKVPVGLPSSLLERRPDIRAAEKQLVAANARIGQAKAEYFPQVNLTTFYGTEAEDFSNILEEDATTWLVGPSVTIPIFTGGRLRGQVDQAEARKEQALLRYRQVVQQAFREVGDALVGVRKSREFTEQQEKLTSTLEDQTKLSWTRYLGGVTTYLEVLDSERQHFEAQLDLARAQLDELLAVVGIYRALGGGWQE
ncbi:MAG: efflux transporter outer membrane subunit [Thermoplasmata archaeon]